MEKSLEQKQEQYNKYRWVILTFVFLCFLFTFVTRFTWPPLIPVMVPVLGISMTQAGAVMSAFYFGYVITQIPAGILADRFGVRLILSASLIIEGLTTFGMGFISTYDAGFWLRFVGGLGAGAVFAACARTIVEWFPPKERGIAFGITLAAPSGGIIVSNYIITALNNAFGWTGAFQIVGLATVILGLGIYFGIKSSAKATDENFSPLDGFRVLLSNKNFVLVALAGFCLVWVELGTATWANAYVRKLGFSLSDAANIMISYGIGGVIGPIVSGYISDRMQNRKNLLLFAYISIIPLTLLFGYQTSVTMLCVIGFIFGFCSYLANPQLSVLISEYAGKELSATANGIGNFVFQIAPMIGPLVIGWSIDFSGTFSIVWWIMAAGPLIGIFLLLPVGKKQA